MSYTTGQNFTAGSVPIIEVNFSAKRGDVNAVSITTIAAVLTPTTGKKYRLLGGDISMGANASVLFEDNAAGVTVYRSPLLLANTPFRFTLGTGYVATAADNVLKATSSAAGSITGTLFYSEE